MENKSHTKQKPVSIEKVKTLCFLFCSACYFITQAMLHNSNYNSKKPSQRYAIAKRHGASKLFNGNISETEWKTASSDNGLKYQSYSYDALNRITAGTDNTNRYSLSGLAYDKNGNITALTRNGHVVENPEATIPSDFGLPASVNTSRFF